MPMNAIPPHTDRPIIVPWPGPLEEVSALSSDEVGDAEDEVMDGVTVTITVTFWPFSFVVTDADSVGVGVGPVFGGGLVVPGS